MTHLRIVFAASIALSTGLAAVPSIAQETQPPGMEFELGAGANFQARYEGADSYVVGPWPIIRLKRLTFPNGFQIGGGDGTGFSLKPSFRYLAERSAEDSPELTGLTDVDAAFELGLGASYTADWWRVFGDLRAGIGGHNGVVGEIGADAIARPATELTVWAGPRASFASADYMDTYFSVTPSESAASGLPVFDADGGFKTVGAEIGMRYDFNALWAMEGSASYDRLIGDAGDSPVASVGSRDQFGLKIGLVRSFQIDF